MKSEAHETAKQLVTLLKTVFESEKVDVEIFHEKYQGSDFYRVYGLIGLGDYSLPIGADSFTLFLNLAWTKKSEFGYAHQWIGPRTRRRKPTYRKISKFWEMVERLKAIGYKIGDYDENPYSFTMAMYHPTPVKLDTLESKELLIEKIRKAVTILREEDPWAMSG